MNHVQEDTSKDIMIKTEKLVSYVTQLVELVPEN
jgi:hypothetical protein